MPHLNLRLFISSTFIDFKQEREWLNQKVFPQFTDYCQQLNVDFQPVDLRWGVSENAGLDQNTMGICLSELKRCHDTSAKPFVLILLGNRYGWRPLPNKVAELDFQDWLEHSGNDERTLLQTWYKADKNDLEPIYRLEPRRGQYENEENWQNIEQGLRALLDRFAVDHPKYGLSATHYEIDQALQLEAATNALVIRREIDNLENDSPQANVYSEQGEGDKAQNSLVQRMDEQCDKALFHHLNCQLNNEKFDDDYKAVFCDLVLNHLKMAVNKAKESDSAAQTIIDRHHQELSKLKAKNIGRPTVELQIKDKLAETSKAPLALIGASGTGKSNLLTSLACANQGSKIVRFIGINQESCISEKVLTSILDELAQLYGQEIKANLPLHSADRLAIALARIPKDNPFTLYLDALDRLYVPPGSISFEWLPLEFPAHIKVLVSIAEGLQAKRLRGLLAKESCMLLDNLTDDDARTMLNTWLSGKNRQLQTEQQNFLISLAKQHSAPH